MILSIISSVQLPSHVQLFATPWTAACQASPSHHLLPELAHQTHVRWVSDAIQPSHPLSSPSPPAFSLSQHQGIYFSVSQFFSSGGQSFGVLVSESVLPLNIQDWFPLGLTGLISLQSKDSQEPSPTLQYKSISFLALSFLYGRTLTSIHDYWKNHSPDRPFSAK